MNKIASWLSPSTKIIVQGIMKVSVEPSSLVISEGGWNPYISTLKLTFFAIPHYRPHHRKGDQFCVENGHGNLASLTL